MEEKKLASITLATQINLSVNEISINNNFRNRLFDTPQKKIKKTNEFSKTTNEVEQNDTNNKQDKNELSLYDPNYYEFFEKIARQKKIGMDEGKKSVISWTYEREQLKKEYAEWNKISDTDKRLSTSNLERRVRSIFQPASQKPQLRNGKYRRYFKQVEEKLKKEGAIPWDKIIAEFKIAFPEWEERIITTPKIKSTIEHSSVYKKRKSPRSKKNLLEKRKLPRSYGVEFNTPSADVTQIKQKCSLPAHKGESSFKNLSFFNEGSPRKKPTFELFLGLDCSKDGRQMGYLQHDFSFDAGATPHEQHEEDINQVVQNIFGLKF